MPNSLRSLDPCPFWRSVARTLPRVLPLQLQRKFRGGVLVVKVTADDAVLSLCGHHPQSSHSRSNFYSPIQQPQPQPQPQLRPRNPRALASTTATAGAVTAAPLSLRLHLRLLHVRGRSGGTHRCVLPQARAFRQLNEPHRDQIEVCAQHDVGGSERRGKFGRRGDPVQREHAGRLVVRVWRSRGFESGGIFSHLVAKTMAYR